MSFADPLASLMATCAGDTVKIFDIAVESGDPCTLSYSPAPGSAVNCVKWNHTNLVIASAGDDKKISLWQKNGQSIGTIPLSGSDLGDEMEETITSISFSNKSSRYLCSGGSGRVVKIWDLQRKRCIKWLTGHADTITGVMYNFKDEHLASISMKGDLILHNLSSGARATELKDPIGQVLRVLDYSRLSRHILVTAGDDGSLHLWDTTGRVPKVSWVKQHSAPTSGVCFSPSSDKIVASVGLDKKLYTYDSGSRRPTSCTPYEAPFSSLAYSDDGNVLAAGTNSGRVVFYDVRGKPQPVTVLRAYNTTEAVASLCWQRSKPVPVNENNCTAETALIGGISEDSVLMPDPLPSMSSFPPATTISSSRYSSTSGSLHSTLNLSTGEETPQSNRLWHGGNLSKLQAPRPSSSYNFMDDMNVFSPLADVQPITPSPGIWLNENDNSKKDTIGNDRNTDLPSSSRRYQFTDSNIDPHPIIDWRSSVLPTQAGGAPLSDITETPTLSSKIESSCTTTPPEAWGGNALPEKVSHIRQPVSAFSQFPTSAPFSSETQLAGLLDSSLLISNSTFSSSTSSRMKPLNWQSKVTFDNGKYSVLPETSPINTASKLMTTSANAGLSGSVFSTLPRKMSTYAERTSTETLGSPKLKKTGAETREELLHNKESSGATTGTVTLPAINGQTSQTPRATPKDDEQQGTSSFLLQLVQRTLEETLGAAQKSIHEDVINLHIDLLRQFHLQEMEMSRQVNLILERQDELMKEVQSLRKENQQLRQLL